MGGESSAIKLRIRGTPSEWILKKDDFAVELLPLEEGGEQHHRRRPWWDGDRRSDGRCTEVGSVRRPRESARGGRDAPSAAGGGRPVAMVVVTGAGMAKPRRCRWLRRSD